MPKRAYIPLLTRVVVTRRQLRELKIEMRRDNYETLTAYLQRLLEELQWRLSITSEPLQLDHDPALGLREKTVHADGHVTYRPRETDHRYLVYRPKGKHLEKTVGRKPGAERTVTTKGSDIWLMQKFRKLGRKPSGRKWPKGAKIPSRPFSKSGTRLGSLITRKPR